MGRTYIDREGRGLRIQPESFPGAGTGNMPPMDYVMEMGKDRLLSKRPEWTGGTGEISTAPYVHWNLC